MMMSRGTLSIALWAALVSAGCTELAEAFTPDAGTHSRHNASGTKHQGEPSSTGVAGRASTTVGGSTVASVPAGGPFKYPRPEIRRSCQDTDEQSNPCSISSRRYALIYTPDTGACGELDPEVYVRLDDVAKSVQPCIDYDKGITADGLLYVARECTYSQVQPPTRVLSQALVELLPTGAIDGRVYVEVREGRGAPCEDWFYLSGEPN